MAQRIFTYLLIMAFFLLNFSEPLLAVQNTGSVDELIKKARTEYYNGQFEQAQEIVLALLKNQKLDKNQQFEALIILAEIRRSLNDESGARKIIRRILKIKPDYHPTIENEPPTFVALVNEERQAMAKEQKAIYQKKNFWFISGAAMLGALTIIILGSKKNESSSKPLPKPPDWPE